MKKVLLMNLRIMLFCCFIYTTIHGEVILLEQKLQETMKSIKISLLIKILKNVIKMVISGD